MYKVGDEIKAEIISIDGAKVFLSAKKLLKDPWLEASAKYKAGQVVPGTILKVNPFGLFVKLDEEIHGLAHVSQLNIGAKEKITDLFKSDEVKDFEVVSVSPSEHRLGLKLADGKKASKKEDKEVSEAKTEEVKEDKKKAPKKVKVEKTEE
jgi:ribosomal protein S1